MAERHLDNIVLTIDGSPLAADLYAHLKSEIEVMEKVVAKVAQESSQGGEDDPPPLEVRPPGSPLELPPLNPPSGKYWENNKS